MTPFVAVSLTDPANHPEIIKMVNSDPESTWVAGENTRFNGNTLADVSKLCGVDRSKQFKLETEVLDLSTIDIPDSFDSRDRAAP